jgi:hypothetical protein
MGMPTFHFLNFHITCNINCTSFSAVQNRIYNGNVAVPHEFPYVVAIDSYVPPDQHFTCGGSLIAREWVITAAHCAEIAQRVDDIAVILGVHNFNNAAQENSDFVEVFKRILGIHDFNNLAQEKAVFAKVIERIIHSNYRKSNIGRYWGISGYDIALLKLRNPVPHRKTMKPICLPKSLIKDYSGKFGTVAGWGSVVPNCSDSLSPVLKKATDMKILPKSRYCLNAVVNNAHSQLCAYSNSSGSCAGDSGGK